MSNVNFETGVQFLDRVKKLNFNLWNLEDSLFIEKLKENDIVGLAADSVYLKNEVLMHLMKRALLVDTFKNLQVGAHNCSVLFIDTAFQFDLKKFSTYLRNYVSTIHSPSLSAPDREEIVQKSLENLVYIPCYDSHQLYITSLELRSMFLCSREIRLVVVDNIGANYYRDLFGRKQKMSTYESGIINSLRSHVSDMKLPILYVRPEFFVSKYPSAPELCSYQINVWKTDEGEVHKAKVQTKTQKTEKIFLISPVGLRWM